MNEKINFDINFKINEEKLNILIKLGFIQHERYKQLICYPFLNKFDKLAGENWFDFTKESFKQLICELFQRGIGLGERKLKAKFLYYTDHIDCLSEYQDLMDGDEND
jgi:hypothetical protein